MDEVDIEGIVVWNIDNKFETLEIAKYNWMIRSYI